MSAVRLAIFGDTHGHLRLMFQLCRLWQLAHRTYLDGVLQCGDLGFFPDITRLDKATKKYAKRDNEELGFADYFAFPQPAKTDELLEKTLNGVSSDLNTVECPVIFCHGNHEDFELLGTITSNAALAPVDVFQRLQYLRSGEVTEIAGLRIAALGGAEEVEDEQESPVLGRCVSRQAASRLRRRSSFDILLTHSSPRGTEAATDHRSSVLIGEVVQFCRPAYHFYAHHTQPIPQIRIGSTLCTWFNDVNFQSNALGRFEGQVEPGCMGVLTWEGPDKHELTIIDEPWFRRLTAQTWRHY